MQTKIVKQLTEKEIIELNTPTLLSRYKTWIPYIIKEGKRSEIEIVEHYLFILKGSEYLEKNYDPKDPLKTFGVIPQIHYTFEKPEHLK